MTTQKVNLDQFSPQELYQLKQGFQAQLNTLNQSMSQFRFAMDKYQQGIRAIKASKECKENEEMLLPLSNALYIQGTLNNIKNNDRVYLIEYGAGFFAERNAEEAIGFYTRKIKLIKQKSEKLEKIMNEKRDGAKQCQMRIMAFVQQQQQQQQPK